MIFNTKFCSKAAWNLQDHAPTVAPVEIVGVIRGSEKPSIFVPENDLRFRQWFYVDIPAISRACELAENTIYIDDIHENVNPSNPYPIPKDVSTLIRSSVMPQDHLNYTFTWYACCFFQFSNPLHLHADSGCFNICLLYLQHLPYLWSSFFL